MIIGEWATTSRGTECYRRSGVGKVPERKSSSECFASLIFYFIHKLTRSLAKIWKLDT